ncbi:E1-E2 ATPase-domain-containing protein [Aspergillus heterothallicus]
MASAPSLLSTLTAFYSALLEYQQSPIDLNLQRLGTFFSETCIAEPRSMRHWKHRAVGRSSTLETYREMLNEQILKERRVVSQVADESTLTVYCEMANRYDVQGLDLDPMLETAVVRFDSLGKIVEWKTYNCQSPVAALTQQATGEGLYADLEGVMQEHMPESCGTGAYVPAPSCKNPDGAPCDKHRRSARAKYAARLEALGCICRTLIALGQESCCAPSSAASLRSERRSTESVRSILRASFDSCCEGDETRSERHRRGSPKGNWKEKACSSGCCSTPKALAVSEEDAAVNPGDATAWSSYCNSTEASAVVDQQAPGVKCCDKSPHVKRSCSTTEQSSSMEEKKRSGRGCAAAGCCSKPGLDPDASLQKNAIRGQSCSTGCCGEPKLPTCDFQTGKCHTPGICFNACSIKPALSVRPSTKETPGSAIEIISGTIISDLEKGIVSQEHIILSISGMTCTGCETKLKRTLGTLPSVQNLKTSLVLSRAEFDLIAGIQSLDEVLRHLEKTTEFKYERISDHGSRLDIIVGDAAGFLKRDWPRGVTEVALIDARIVSVSFDAKVIGARDLLEHGWDSGPLCLAAPRPDPSLAAGSKHVRHMGYMTILSIILTIPVLVLAWVPLPERPIAYGSASLALASIVQLAIAGPFYPKALKALIFSRIIEMDLLIVLSTSAAYIFSVVSFGYLVAGQPLATGEFFETSTLLVALIMVGRYVAALARQKAIDSISLQSLQTPTAILVDESGANEKEVDVRLLQYGDIFKVIPDSKIPTDGTVIGGSSEVDESMITGEAIPVAKYTRSSVIAGSVNGSGTLVVRLTRLPSENTVSVIAGMVDQAKLSKPRIQDIADRVASYFVPVVVVLAIITFVIWIAVGIALREQSGSRAIIEAITYAITVLIVSCPCAIGLAVPMVIVIASGVAAEHGIIFKSADSIEVACKASHVIFDKTGTLTEGKFAVTAEHILDTRQESATSILLGLIGSNKHPISAAVAAHLKARGISASTVTDIKVLTGKGVQGSTEQGHILRAGNSRWLNQTSNPLVISVLDQGYTALCFTINDTLVAVFGLGDSRRSEAHETVTKLKDRGVSVHILSGDDDAPVQSIARELGIAAGNCRSRCTPTDKQAYIKALAATSSTPSRHEKRNQRKNKHPVIIFTGDGTNDAIALATSTIGVHLSPASDTNTESSPADSNSALSSSAASVILLRPNLTSILTMMTISERSMRRIRFNFAWSFVYNLFAVLLGAGAFVDARIPPRFAGLGEIVSVLPVVVVAVSLRWPRGED